MEQQKIEALLGEMSLDEKINQLFQGNGMFYEGESIATGPVSAQGFTEQTIRETGSVLSIIGAETVKKLQKAHMENHPHKIPLVFMADIINGYKTVFPIPLGQGAMFNPEMAKTGAEVAAKEAAASGIHVTFAPMVDLVRDARWGRVMESTGEDAYLNSVYAKALVEGYQGEDPKAPGKIGACVKHFAGYGGAMAGRDYNNAELSERTLRDDYLPAYEAAVKAGALLVMTSFNTLNHVPSTANKWLMRQVLREEMGFDGAVISDWAAIEEIKNHGAAADLKEAAKLAMEAGCDIDMMTTCYANYLKELIENKELDEKLLDEAVLRVLELKNKLGLFENPYKDADEEAEKELLLCKDHRKKAKEAAKESFVLLRNKKMLPLKKDEKVAFIGPYVEEKSIIGAWSVFADEADAVSVKEGVKNLGIKAIFAKGCDSLAPGETIHGMNKKYTNNRSKADAEIMLGEAVDAALKADKVVLCIGEHMAQTGEGASRADITIPKHQKRLLKEVARVNKNVIVVLFTGRPLDVRKIKEVAKAIMVVWMPGTEGGNAIAEVLYGKTAPSGKLPMSFPYSVGQVPVFYDEFRTGRYYDGKPTENRFLSKYLDVPNKPLYPFGYGLSYTEFSYSKVKLSADCMKSGEEITASVKVKNEGRREGAEVVQLYICDEVGSVVRPVRELKGFEKVWLAPGEEKEITFTITEEMLKFYDINMEYKAEPGKFIVYAGGCSDTENAAEFTFG
ncbi:MAG: beta-glucosidase BglX [Lachnospiraceae bacterium]|nr:beta-glucosidase BglX [Lachnospiraceae bacterium]